MKKEVWQQAIRLARALDDANRAGNTDAAQIHHRALLDVLRQIIKEEDKNEEIRKKKS
jgi:hypothetical protein